MRQHHVGSSRCRPRGGRGLALAALLALGGCGRENVQLELAPNQYLILPYATAAVADGQLTVTPTGLWPLATGFRYVCWAAGPTLTARLLGTLAGAKLVVGETALPPPATFAAVDTLLVTIESEASPSAPSGDEVLRGAPGSLLQFGGPSLLAQLGAASATVTILGATAEYVYDKLPALPRGFRYGLYLKGLLPDPGAASGVHATHQHLAAEPGLPPTPAGALRLAQLARLPGGQNGFTEPSGLNLTGLTKGLVVIEAARAASPIDLVVLAGPAGTTLGVGNGSTPAASGPTPTGYDIRLQTSPAHAHTGDVVTFTFTVSAQGTPLTELTPTASYELSNGAEQGVIALAPTAGGYAGTKAFFTTGSYTITFKFTRAGQDVVQPFELTIESH